MDTKLFDCFLEVTRAGNFAGAARSLGIDPSAVSRAISQLETELGARLFQRTTRRLTLTEAGELFRRRIEGVVSEIAQIQDELTQEDELPRGRVCITTSVAFGQTCLVPLLDQFFSTYPDIELELKLTDHNADLVAERVDFALRLTPAPEQDVVAAKLMRTHYRVCANPTYLKTNRPSEISDISELSTICFDIPEYRRSWLFKFEDSITEVPIKPKLVISNALSVRDATRAGLGVALLPNWLIQEDLADGCLIDLFPEHEVTATEFDTAAWIIYPSRAFLPRKTRLTIDFFRDNIRAVHGF